MGVCSSRSIHSEALGTAAITDTRIRGNEAVGGDGGEGANGGNGFGGGLFNDGPSTHPSNPGVPTILAVLASTITEGDHTRGFVP